jgi:hypothetical protein
MALLWHAFVEDTRASGRPDKGMRAQKFKTPFDLGLKLSCPSSGDLSECFNVSGAA